MRTLLPLSLFACSIRAPEPQPASPTEAELEMRVFDVAAGNQELTASLINRLLPTPKDGRAMKGPNGTVVVVASSSVLDGVGDLVGRLEDAPAPAETGPATVELEYWVVTGKPAAEPVIPQDLQTLGPAVEAIITADGPQTLSRRNHQRLVTRQGRAGTLDTNAMRIEQRIEVDESDRIHAEIEIRLGGEARFETEIAVQPGKYVVLAQAEVQDDNVYIVARPTLK